MAHESALSTNDLNALAQFDTCTISNAIERFDIRLRNTGFADASIRCMLEGSQPMVGYAATARLRSGEPPIAGRRFHDRTDWWNSILEIPAPRIVVLEDLDKPPGRGAFIGDAHAAILQALGCVGYVTDGAVRELPGIRRLGLQVFAGQRGGLPCLCPHLRFWIDHQGGGIRNTARRSVARRFAWTADGSDRYRKENSRGSGEVAERRTRADRFLPFQRLLRGEIASDGPGVMSVTLANGIAERTCI